MHARAVLAFLGVDVPFAVEGVIACMRSVCYRLGLLDGMADGLLVLSRGVLGAVLLIPTLVASPVMPEVARCCRCSGSITAAVVAPHMSSNLCNNVGIRTFS